MAITISPLTEHDIPGAITAIQEAFANDPYNLWVFNDRQKLSLTRNSVSLGIRCRWGIRNALFYVAKDTTSDHPDKVLGISCWLPPKPADEKETWGDWFEGWKLWSQQVCMNVWYGRGGLNVKRTAMRMKRYYIWKQKQAEAQSEIWTDPKGYYFLNIMVVLPGQQGKGIGKLLAGEVTKKADEEGIKCYLESSRDVPNMKIYESMGFHFVKGMDCVLLIGTSICIFSEQLGFERADRAERRRLTKPVPEAAGRASGPLQRRTFAQTPPGTSPPSNLACWSVVGYAKNISIDMQPGNGWNNVTFNFNLSIIGQSLLAAWIPTYWPTSTAFLPSGTTIAHTSSVSAFA
ncbi:hypothetical protein BP5796_00475 [Coleophoma crateriformis]|uniref:N-acetyltransferase domain-containing protein n=1 Tax=Coleophoma crateriformis TaxID=565419 RepID=A0A3D8T7Z2_9HELO|nr:hypothetical protein BP5796_00475 [Coleophoma crateriformis]